MGKFFQVETRGGTPIATAGGTVTPFSKAFILRLPGARSGLVWNRPVSVLVSKSGGEEAVMPVEDVTRQVIWTLLGASILTFLVGMLFRRRSD